MLVRPFKALRCTSDSAQLVSCVPYDVVDVDEARALAGDNHSSFLRVVRSEIDLPPSTSPYDDVVYERAATNLSRLEDEGLLVRETQPCLYVYRMTTADHTQTGLLACCSIQEYRDGLIKKHELTRRDKEDDRTRHILTMRAQTGPVIATYRDDNGTAATLRAQCQRPADFSATSEQGVVHEIWVVKDTSDLEHAFARISVAYIADGHHRSASAERAQVACEQSNPTHDGTEEYNFFLTALFPSSEMNILAYNRVAKDLNGRSATEFLDLATQAFDVTKADRREPSKPREFCIYLDGHWYTWHVKSDLVDDRDPIQCLDCSILQQHCIGPLLGIEDVRSDPRIGFVGGIRGSAALTEWVDRGQAQIAFSLYPTSIEQLMMIADADEIMPPKSTWFEPKLRSGLIVHTI